MACITMVAQPMAMATTQLTQALHYEDASVWQLAEKVEHSTLSLSWVVVTDDEGNRRLQMKWAPSADLR